MPQVVTPPVVTPPIVTPPIVTPRRPPRHAERSPSGEASYDDQAHGPKALGTRRTEWVVTPIGLRRGNPGRHWHIVLLAAWAAVWYVVMTPQGGYSWRFFAQGGTLLVGRPYANSTLAGGLHIYANYPDLQIGPFALAVAAVLAPLGSTIALFLVQATTALAGLALVPTIEQFARAARPDLARRAGRLRGTVLVAGALFLPAWIDLTVHYSHLDDALALTAAALAVRALVNGSGPGVGIMLALATDSKPWAVAFLPLLFALPRHKRLVASGWALGLMTAAWLPFVIVDPQTLVAAHFTIPNVPSSALRVLGVTDPMTPSWDRPAQAILGWVLGAVAVRRRRWPAVILLGVGARIALDPSTYGYYTAGVMLGALVWDVLGSRRPFPLWSILSFAALTLPLAFTQNAHLLGELRLGLVVAFTLALLLAPAAVYSTDPSTANPSAASAPVPRPRATPSRRRRTAHRRAATR